MKNSIFNAVCKTRYLALLVVLIFTCGNAWGETYNLYSDAITEGDYIIVYDGKAMKNSISSNRWTYETVTISSNKITNPTNEAKIVWHIAASGDYWTIYSNDASQYAVGTGTKNQGGMSASPTSNGEKWTVTGTSTYEFVNKRNADASVNKNLRGNGTNGFACYSTSTGGALSLYKKAVSTPTTITLSEAGNETIVSGTHYVGEEYTLPTTTDASCGTKVLVGWSTVTVSATDTKPASNFYAKGATVTLGATNKFYAVFANVTSSSSTTTAFSKYSGALTTGDYVFTYGSYVMGNTISSNRCANGTFPTIVNDVISGTPAESIVWTIGTSVVSGTTYYTLYNASTSRYLAKTSNNNQASLVTSVDDGARYSCSSNANSTTYDFVNKGNSRYLRNNTTNGWAMYSSSTGGALTLYKKGTVTTTVYDTTAYATTCCADPGLNYGTGNVTKTYGEGVFTNTLTNSHSVAVTYAASNVTPAGCITVNSSTGAVTINGAGSATITASSAAQTKSGVSYCADEASYILTVNKASISPTLSYTPNSVTVGGNTSAPTVGGNPGSGGVTYAITSASPSGCATIDAGTGIVTGVVVGSVTVTATVAATTNYNGGSATANVTITAASGYCISLFNSSNNGIQNGFSNGGSGSEYTLSFTVPGKDGSSNWPMYWIGENNASQSYSANAYLADMKFTHSDATLGLAEGATGTLHIWDDNKAAGSNLHVKFEPSGYGLRWGGAGEWNQAANTKAFTVDANDANVYWTDLVTLDGTNNTTWNYYVGLQTASGYVYSGVDDEANDSRGLSRTTSVTAMKVSNGTSGSFKATYLNSEPTGSKGKFRIWDNNISSYNFVCHWVPFYEATYDANGGGAVSTTSVNVGPVCCEGSASARQVTMPAAPEYAHHTFDGWKSSADNVTYAVGTNVSLSQNTTFTAQWTAVPEATITLSNYSGSAVTTGYYDGDDFTLPTTNSYTCGLKTFVGWSTVAVDSPTKPTAATYYEPGATVTLAASNTFYAVFADDNSEDDEITLSSTGVNAGSSSYSDWSGLQVQTDAEYAGNNAGGQSADNGSIQLRSKNGTSGVVTTTSGGSAKIVAVEWNSYMSQDRTIDIYGKNTAYTAVSDLYGDDSGTLLGSISWTSLSQETELTITGDYAYIGLRSHDGAIYLNNITITWSSGYSNYSTTCVTYYDINTAVSPAASGSVTLSQSSAPAGGTATATAVPAEGYGFGSWAITGGATLSSTSTNPTTITMGSADATITATFLPKCATPTFSPAGSTYTSAQSVTISSSTTGSTIYYTTDGSDPTTGSSHGTAGDASVTINVSSTTTIKAIAVKSGTNANSDIASATYTIKSGKLFSLVTDEDDLVAGDELVIVGYASSTPHVMSTTQNSNNRGMTDVDWEFISSNLFVEDKVSSTVQVITLEGSAGEWYFNVGTDAYLYAASSSSNWLRTTDKTTAGDNAKWDISIGSGDTYYATVIAQGTYTRNMLQYNNNSSIFSCYASNNPQQSIQLYRYANTAPVVNVGMPTGTNFTYVYGNGPSATQTFTINGNNLTGNVVITPPSNYQIKNGSGEWGTSAITLTPDGNGAIAVTTISIRLAGGLSAGSYDGNITFTNNDELTIPNIAVTGTVDKATLNPLFEMATYTIVRNVSTSTTFAFINLPEDYTGTITYSRSNNPTPSARLVIDGTNKTFTAASYSGRWTVTANFPADANYNLKNGVTCTVNAVTRDTYVDNVNGQSVTEEQATDNGVDPYISPALDDVAAGVACQGTKTHLLGWASQAFVTKVGNGTLSGDKSDYTEENGFYAIGTTLPAASNTTYYAVWGELDE